MKYKELKESIRLISEIKDDKGRLEEFDNLAYLVLEKPKIKKIVRGHNWVYFYLVLSFDKDGNEVLGESIGKIASETYKQNKIEIKELRISGKIEELKKFMEGSE